MTQLLGSRVFISYGQRDGSDEPEIAHELADRFGAKGFDPYVAVGVQSLPDCGGRRPQLMGNSLDGPYGHPGR
jgi:hypothetical protein